MVTLSVLADRAVSAELDRQRQIDKEVVVDVTLTEEESRSLQQALRSYLSDLRMEISDTDNRKFRDGLREERRALESVVEKLDSASAGSSKDGGPGVVRMLSVWWSIGAADR